MKSLMLGASLVALSLAPKPVAAQPEMPESPPLPAVECRVPPRPLSEVEALLAAATPAPEGDASDEPLEAELPDGPAASEEVAAAVTAVETEYVACLNAGDYPRALALLSDGATRVLLRGLDEDPRAWYAVAATPVTETDEGYEVSVLTVRDVRELGPNRVGAVVWWGTPGNAQYPEETLFHEFVKVDGQWRFDDETTVYYP